MRSFKKSLLITGTLTTLAAASLALYPSPSNASNSRQSAYKDWMLGPFQKENAVNPILGPEFDSQFFCPVSRRLVRWEARAVLGAAVIVRNDKLWMIYHAEDSSNGFQGMRGTFGTLREGLAESSDGLHFQRRPEPVIYPADDAYTTAEWPGGCEIPRIVEGPDGTYYLYYSAWNRIVTRLSVATSQDLVHWTKHGLIFEKAYAGKYRELWSKGGAVVTELRDGRLVAVKIKGRYWMYFGESSIFAATSENLLDWTPVELSAGQTNPPLEVETAAQKKRGAATRQLVRVQDPRNRFFDSDLVEGGVAISTSRGIVHIYNASDNNSPASETWKKESPLFYSVGQALYSASDPLKLIDRSDTAFLQPDQDFEKLGCTPNVVYLTGIAWFQGKWRLYYNGADWMIGTASTK
ncbi:MAG: glycoside hydrolase family 130 protein [Acidobacteriota bacterium]|nr:glycoside hydrolase family 130 protein [Acidobacteriota bacterium]